MGGAIQRVSMDDLKVAHATVNSVQTEHPNEDNKRM